MQTEQKPSNNKIGVMPLFPTMDSLEAVLELGLSQLPLMTPNALTSILCTYHNTLVTLINKENNNVA